MLKIVKKKSCSKREVFFIQISAILLALVFSSIFIGVTGNNPIKVYISMLDGAFGSSFRFRETIINSIPLLITSLGISVAFKMKFWNIGAEGQFVMGAFLGSYFALNFNHLPKIILLPLMLLGGIVGGGLWGLIPAFFRAKFRTNETIFTLLMNYIAIKWITYLQYGPWKDPNGYGFPKIPKFKPNAILPKIGGVHIGLFIATILVVLVYYYINHTKQGYEVSVIGESENTAIYAGMKVDKIILRTIFISAAIAGLAGIIQASAVNKTLAVTIANGTGYTSIIIAWLSNLNAFIALIVSILFSAMVQGGAFIQMTHNIPASAAGVLQGTILFFVLGSQFFTVYKIKRN